MRPQAHVRRRQDRDANAMNEMPRLNFEQLKQRHLKALELSAAMVRAHPAAYRELKKKLNEINTCSVDISEYYRTALDLARLLRVLTRAGGRTLFDFFYFHIDPGQNGDVRYFRCACRDLADQLDALDRWRAQQHHLRVIG
jgi:hypothetical protein